MYIFGFRESGAQVKTVFHISVMTFASSEADVASTFLYYGLEIGDAYVLSW